MIPVNGRFCRNRNSGKQKLPEFGRNRNSGRSLLVQNFSEVQLRPTSVGVYALSSWKNGSSILMELSANSSLIWLIAEWAWELKKILIYKNIVINK